MAVRARHHVNPLKSDYLTALRPSVALPEAREVEVELGCADAQFLFERAHALPSIFCVGVEIRHEYVDDVNARAAAAGIVNLLAVFANINADLERLFPDGRLARVFLNFPDPWFKRRHYKRRVLTLDVARTIARKLSPGGVFFVQTDVFDLALDALAVLEEIGPEMGLRNQAGEWSFTRDNPWGARSLREERVDAKGIRVWRLAYLKG